MAATTSIDTLEQRFVDDLSSGEPGRDLGWTPELDAAVSRLLERCSIPVPTQLPLFR